MSSNIPQSTVDFLPSKVRAAYSMYVNTVSTPVMAISEELAGYLWYTLTNNPMTRLLDLGSGFSSFLFRYYQATTPGVTVYSVDTDEGWLTETVRFLNKFHLSTDNMYLWKDCIHTTVSLFHLVLCDIADIQRRLFMLDDALRLTARSGMTVYDDVHIVQLRRQLDKVVERRKCKMMDLQSETGDEYGRWSRILLPE